MQHRMCALLPSRREKVGYLNEIKIVGRDGQIGDELPQVLRTAGDKLIQVARRQLSDEAAIRRFAIGMLQEGLDGATEHLPPDFRLMRSWFFEDHFFYEARNRKHRVILASSLIDRGYAINTVWFVDANVAVAVEGHAADVPRFNRFLDHASLARPTVRVGHQNRRLVVGFPHMLHMLWNGISPVVKLVQESGGLSGIDLHVTFEPFGPIERLVPEFRGKVTRLSPTRAAGCNDRFEVSCGVAGWQITRETQARILQLAREFCSSGTIEASTAFAARFDQVIWITAKPGDRNFVNEASVLSGLLASLAVSLPRAGFVVDGSSYPWDFARNANYDGFFRSHIEGLTIKSAAHIADIIGRLPSNVRNRIMVLNGVGVHDEVVWGSVADFYVAHGGSMQHKIGWIHSIPGYVHSNELFLHHFKHIRVPPLEGSSKVYYPQGGVLVDDDPGHYSTLQLARKDQRYSVPNPRLLASDVLAAFRDSIRCSVP